MIPLKARLTKLLFKTAYLYPCIFSKRLVFLAQSYATKSATQVEDERLDDTIKEASLLDDKTTWRGIHILFPVNKTEAKRAQKYFSKNSQNYQFSFFKKNDFNVGFFGSGTQNFGDIAFNGDILHPAMNVALATDSLRYCSVNLICLENSIAYLSLYMGLSEVATKKISRVDVGDIERYSSFASLNPFSKGFGVVTEYDRYGQIDNFVYDAAKNIADEAAKVAIALLKSWGIRKKPNDFTKMADFSRNSSHPYFSEANESESQHRSVIDESRGMLAATPSGKAGEELITYNIPERIGVDAVFINSEDHSQIEESELYINSEQSGLEKYAVFLYIKSAEKKLSACADKIGFLFNSGSPDSKSTLKGLISRNLELSVIDENIDALRKAGHWFDTEYTGLLKAYISRLTEQSSALKLKIQSRHDISTAEVQLSNLHWMKRYSMLMFVLVVAQVTLALIAVDWSTAGIDKNAMYQNYLAIKEFLFD